MDEPLRMDISPSWALSTAMLDELNSRMPGFRSGVRARLVRSATAMAASDDPGERRDAAAIQDLVTGWVFTE